MQDQERQPPAADHEISFRTDRVEAPQQYSTWRDYAFSDEPESETTLPR